MFLDRTALEARVAQLGTEIFREVERATPGVFDPQFYAAKLIEWAMEDEEFKISLFRFVDVFPTLAGSAAIVSHAQEYFKPVAHRIPGIVKWGLNVDPNSISAKIAAPVIAHQIKSMAGRFIVGETPQNALRQLKQIRRAKFAFTVDLLGEATLGNEEAAEYHRRYLELLETLLTEVPTWREARPIVEGHRGESSAVNISVKLSALYSQAKALATDRSVEKLSEKLAEILIRAKAGGAFVFIDMEDTGLVSITLETVKRVLSDSNLRDYDRCGFVLQAYLRRTENDLEELIKWGRARGTPFGVRLVKGAYWDTETILAKQRHWAVPVWEEKSSTDACYERLSLRLLQNADLILPAFASHNLRSLSFVACAAEALGVAKTDFELQALYGMAEPIKRAFVDRGYLIREYAPVGELLPGMSYLVRRLLENTSNEGFLRQTFREHERAEKLLAPPEADPLDTGVSHLGLAPRDRFFNVPLADFSEAPVRQALARQIENLRGKLRTTPETVKPVISGQHVDTPKELQSLSPEDAQLIVARVGLADQALAEQAVAKLHAYFPVWRATSVEFRAEILFRAADELESRRAELSAVIVLEAGKPWAEADGDVCEAVDFLRYYAHEAKVLFQTRKLGNSPGELNTYFYEPRGVTTVICPWNFPLAIPCGMFAAALVTGNCAILKPAEQSSLIARYLYDTFVAAGLPDDAASFLPGYGEELGPLFVRDPRVSTIVFTGSKAVGLQIFHDAAKTPAGADHVKRVIAEMGGKNAIIIDDDADLDEAIRGVVYSAFGFQGQKCSACSRAIVVGSLYERFLARLKDAVKSIAIGPASDPATFVGPVIDGEAHSRLRAAIERGKANAKVLVEGEEFLCDPLSGNYVRPTVFYDVDATNELLTAELFGPVLAVTNAPDFAAALREACNSEYALTGAVFSRSPAHIAEAIEAFRVGNLYINRGSTGALVYRQPFGGAKMSGVGSKAGGPDYLLQFVIPRAVSENTMRRGFAPKV